METQTNDKHDNGQLFIVATPIGNLADITYRAVETLKSVDLIAAEDTRVSRRLCDHYGITTPLIACHEHNEEKKAVQLLEAIREGKNIALISDAGTPLINDPGYRLVSMLREHGIRITPIPGACSPIAALCASGLPTDSFAYDGFLARSGKARRRQIEIISHSPCTRILLESPHRLLHTLDDLRQACGDARQACVAREITKLYETFVSGSLLEVRETMGQKNIRGEIVLVIGPETLKLEVSDADISQALDLARAEGLSPSALAKSIARQLDVPRSRVYDLLLEANRQQE
ncbi:MAG: 16S rRNA (cytidine(1402)-2'-O)-methyltransferase [Zetaproteobacteria bacterium CG12_big_fil_rev_8_21_14_0_65_55_1124]|nr:MAG: 16S rRNA (cytidine(1402)-2'-O)-methyltransferase [Zetaproteobacteria bacterium CG1_02_55_237]PIS19148.1 MAG: 16S rRNA (cytidine(1402)-2'-O)-methyltransferase [Zetaproteobacteria bacterium CG08_land_8_20_14_0_20_55_17]PIW43844.1 MAG: 16S rRNA (cytidine(1402)-2'-O)-methyltransferase [Zetaproteobacteria bacterium CG12_big_fil_rev_8_21_14_0_65_55_1124]PIY52989.1 MAG: 16S rRNA (cytidine(1402)-2'-O)-methyltransferase [Zetaproteobacteria bacterium CG_4_10_14_0_8_um_filter_55_43]PIZ37623.1 MAG: